MHLLLLDGSGLGIGNELNILWVTGEREMRTVNTVQTLNTSEMAGY